MLAYPEISRLRRWVCLLSVLIVGGTLLATLTPMPFDRTPPSVPFLEGFTYLALGSASPTDIAANFLMFVPVGAAIAAALAATIAAPRSIVPAAAALALLLSIGIEWTQVFIPGRYPSLIDVVSNATGGLTGAISVSVAVTRLDRLRSTLLKSRPAQPPSESRRAA